ncbi:MAG: acyltransferase [Candidatus Thorarchaeota archaeon]|nr:MAG: acyltransferase [Candidatus Thorarchaeota archaeon]
MSNRRVSWIDLAKTLSLVLVITVHSLEINLFSAILTGVAIPAFFILYGLAHNNEKHHHNIKNLLRARFMALMIPYFILSIAMLLIYTSTYSMFDLGLTPGEFVFWTIYGNGPIQRVSHLWYLRTMFFAIALLSIFDRYLHDKPAALRILIALSLPAMGVLIKTVAGVELLPWSIDSVLIALSFMIIGNEIRKYQNLSSWGIAPSFDAVALTLSLVLFVLLAAFNGYVNIGMSLYGFSIYIYMATGLLGTYFLSVLSYHACNNFDIALKISKFNNYSQEIYEIHPLMIELNVQLLGGLTIWNAFLIFPDTPLFLINLLSAVFVSWLLASKIISNSRILQFVFLGRTKPRTLSQQSSPAIQSTKGDIDALSHEPVRSSEL